MIIIDENNSNIDVLNIHFMSSADNQEYLEKALETAKIIFDDLLDQKGAVAQTPIKKLSSDHFAIGTHLGYYDVSVNTKLYHPASIDYILNAAFNNKSIPAITVEHAMANSSPTQNIRNLQVSILG